MTKTFFCVMLYVALVGTATEALAAKPSPAEALKLAPVQPNVDYDRPTGGEIAKCVVDVEAVGSLTGWVVKTEAGQLLRRFLDTNGDNKVDQWCYFKDGIEIYRDIDANFNNKADQYRWLGTAGTRWGLDGDEDQRIDRWKTLSAEEATAEIVAALRDKDAARFRRVLISADELAELGLSDEQLKDLSAKISAATADFAEVAGRQKLVTAKSEWLHFGASRPGVVPAGTGGSEKDLVVYDNVTTVVETDGKHSQLAIGTLVKIGDTWRIFDLPRNLTGEATAAASIGYFFQAAVSARPAPADSIPGSTINPEMQKLIVSLEKLDQSIAAAASPREQSRLNDERADVLEKIIKLAPTAEDRNLWVRQYAETISAAMQSGGYPEGTKRLAGLAAQVARLPDSANLVAYLKFRQMSVAYNMSLQEQGADFEKINGKWMQDLEEFVKVHKTSPDAAEAMLQLAIGNEFSGKDKEAITWFTRITTEFPRSDLAPKAAGAKRRLESVGKPISLKSKTLDGRPFDLASASGKVVLIHYWATWCEPCKQDLAAIRALQAKYGKDGFLPVGVNLDSKSAEATEYLRGASLPWPQLHEGGGLEGRLAEEMGILTLPTMILVSREGKVLNRNIHAGELDSELKKLLR